VTKQERREAMPLVTEFIDEIRESFGADAIERIVAEENGHRIEWSAVRRSSDATKRVALKTA
jgi:hypothetical protein